MEPVADPVAVGRQRAPGSRLFLLSLVAFAAATGLGSLLAWRAASRDAQAQAVAVAERAALAVETRFEAAAAGLAGADAVLGPDGRPSQSSFERFAADVVAGGRLTGLALVVPVPEEERAAVESAIGGPVHRAGPNGPVPAPPGDGHQVVVAVQPSTLDALIGFDYGTDPVRGPALADAARSGRLVVVELAELQAIGGPGAVLVQPLGEPGPGPAGFVVGALGADTLLDSVDAVLAPDDRVQLLVSDELMFGDDLGGAPDPATVPVEIPGREWHLVLDIAAGPDLTLFRALLVGGTVGVLVLFTVFLLTRRHQRRMAAANRELAAAEARARAVAALVGNLSRSLSADQVAKVLLRRLPAIVGASAGAVAMVDEDGSLHLLAAEGHPPEEASAIAALEPPPTSLVARALGDLTPQWLSSPLGWRGDEATAVLAGQGNWALALVPLVADQVRGVLAVSYASVHTFSEVERDLLVNIGLMASRSLSRAGRYDAEHAAALAFQRAALPDALPDVDGLDIAARYRPASRRAAVGGDWYDVIVLDADRPRVACVVGDVVGHGMSAAAAMGRLRTACQAVAPLRPDTAALVRAVSEQAGTITDAMATTMVCATVDVATGELAWTRAGHPPPLLLDPDGTPTFLDATPLPPLGVLPLDDGAGAGHRVTMGPGQTLVLYTDGVIERRDERLDDSLRRLAVAAGNLVDLDVESFSDALLEALVPDAEQGDDVALLVVRMVSPPAG